MKWKQPKYILKITIARCSFDTNRRLASRCSYISKPQSNPSTLGCFSALYQSVINLGNEHFCAEVFKDMLLHPRSSADSYLQLLKINIDDMKTKYFICLNEYTCSRYMSIYRNTKCPGCRMNSMSALVPSENSSILGNVFVSRAVRFIITDDLEVKPVVPGTVIDLINNLGISDMSVIEERTVKLGSNEVLELLKLTMLSTTPLTDLFVSKKKLPGGPVLNKLPPQQKRADNSGEGKKLIVKAVLKKSSKQFLFLEAGKDFMDFLVSFLVMPLAGMLHIMEGQSCLGSLDALYKSVVSLDSKYFISEAQKKELMRPRLPPPFDWKNHLFPLESTPIYCFIQGAIRTMPANCEVGGVPSSGGFLRGETSFFVSDNLEVTPLSAVSSFSMLNRNKVSVSDLEERTLSFGLEEGISILRASLNSTSAISNGLLHNSLIFKEPKQEK